ncbi:MAG: hypothetical protein ACRD1C_08265 [Terriglobales bacterium]
MAGLLNQRIAWAAIAALAAGALIFAARPAAQGEPSEETVTATAPFPATSFARPTGLVCSPNPYNELFIADTGHNEIKDCLVGGSCSVIAGNGTPG